MSNSVASGSSWSGSGDCPSPAKATTTITASSSANITPNRPSQAAPSATSIIEPQNPFENPALMLSGSSSDPTSASAASLLPTTSSVSMGSAPISQSPQVLTPVIPSSPINPRNTASPLITTTIEPSSLFFATSAPPLHFPDDTDDEHTAPSSAANTHDASSPGHLHHRGDLSRPNQHNNHNVHHNHPFHSSTAGLSRFLELTRKRFSSGGGPHHDDYDSDDDLQSAALIAGYLQKLGRNGKWQTRWFETDGECLSYYKNSKRSKLLATLDLEKVGAIEIDLDDPSECSFRIQVMGRLYHLRADSRGVCRDWVITLNRVKEARLQQGNVKLIHTSSSSYNNGGKPFDLLLDFQQQNQQPQVVVVSNRERTRAVDEAEHWDQLIRDSTDNNDGFETLMDPYTQRPRMSAISTVVVARWSKRHSTIQKVGSKLSKLARSLKKYSCTEVEQETISLDRHVHPPGHDYNTKPSIATKTTGTLSKDSKQVAVLPSVMTNTIAKTSAWPDKETTSSSSTGSTPVAPLMTVPSTIPVNNNEERNRSMSVTSDYDSRMIS